jgi:hypothetical protein
LAPSESGPGQIAWFEAPADPLNGSWIRHDIADAEDVHLIVTTGSHNIAVGDIENDGDIDIVGANWDGPSPDGGRVNRWRNDIGASTVLPLDQWTGISIDTSKPDQAFGLAFGDIDGDAQTDIVTGRGWYRSAGGNLTGNWTRTDFGQDVDAMLLVDVDGDSGLDIIAEGAASAGNVPVLWMHPQNAAGSQWTTTTIGTIPSDPADGRSPGFALAQIVPGGRPEIVLSSLGLYVGDVNGNSGSDGLRERRQRFVLVESWYFARHGKPLGYPDAGPRWQR